MNKVSIIIPVYNSYKNLNRCLDSVINQTYKNIEIIIINDGSTDRSLDILNEYKKKDNRIKVYTIKNSGVSYARNYGIKKSNGEYIMFIDSDDYIELNMVEKMMNSLVSNKVDIVRCNNFVEEKTNYVESYYLKNKLVNKIDSNIISDIITSKLLTYCCVLLVKKDVLLKTNLFNVDLKIYEDRVFYLELFLKAKNVYFMEDVLYHYVTNNNGCTKSNKNITRHLFDTINGWKIINDILEKENYNELIIILNTKYLYMIIGYLFASYKYNTKKFKEIYNKVIKDDNFNKILCLYNDKEFSLYVKLCIYLLKNNKYTFLKIVYFFRKIISYIKDIIKK